MIENMRNHTKGFLFYVTTLIIGFTIGGFSAHVDAKETAKNRQNSLDVNEVYTNPNTYLFGAIVDGAIIRGDRDGEFYTSIRVQPYHTAALYDENVLFCGNVGDEFNGKSRVVVLTYETRAHTLFKGIACHELTSVFEVQEPKQ